VTKTKSFITWTPGRGRGRRRGGRRRGGGQRKRGAGLWRRG